MSKNWIKGAIKKPGSLRAIAKKEGGIDKSGNISESWKQKKAASPKTSTSVKRKINLAKTLGKMKKK